MYKIYAYMYDAYVTGILQDLYLKREKRWTGIHKQDRFDSSWGALRQWEDAEEKSWPHTFLIVDLLSEPGWPSWCMKNSEPVGKAGKWLGYNLINCLRWHESLGKHVTQLCWDDQDGRSVLWHRVGACGWWPITTTVSWPLQCSCPTPSWVEMTSDRAHP